MRLDDALEQLSAIHVQVLRSETYRGYRAGPVAATGMLALIAAGIQVWACRSDNPVRCLSYWIAVAAAAGLLSAAELFARTLRDTDPHARRRTRLALQQAMPAIGVGAMLTLALVATPGGWLLPAIWSMCFGLGVIASRPFLPGPIVRVAAFYLCIGAALLLPGLQGPHVTPIAMGLTFGVGQLWAAWILHRAEAVANGR